MKALLLFTFILSFSVHAENSRSPAVLDGTCNTNVPTTMTKVIDGKNVVMERPVADILKDQCKAVKQCMYSANEEDMDQLKSLEAVACNNNLNAVTTKTPGATVDKNFDAKRRSKFRPEELEQPASAVSTPTTISK